MFQMYLLTDATDGISAYDLGDMAGFQYAQRQGAIFRRPVEQRGTVGEWRPVAHNSHFRTDVIVGKHAPKGSPEIASMLEALDIASAGRGLAYGPPSTITQES